MHRDKIESNLSVPGVESLGAIGLSSIRAFKQAPSCYFCRLAFNIFLQGQPKSRPDPKAGPWEIVLMLAYILSESILIPWSIFWGRSWNFLVPSYFADTFNLVGNLSLCKCALWHECVMSYDVLHILPRILAPESNQANTSMWCSTHTFRFHTNLMHFHAVIFLSCHFQSPHSRYIFVPLLFPNSK